MVGIDWSKDGPRCTSRHTSGSRKVRSKCKSWTSNWDHGEYKAFFWPTPSF